MRMMKDVKESCRPLKYFITKFNFCDLRSGIQKMVCLDLSLNYLCISHLIVTDGKISRKYH